MHFTPEDISLWFGLIASIVAIYGKFKADVIIQEKRLTVLEKDNEYAKEFQRTASKRLDNHDKQNEALVRMNTSLEYLTEKVDAIDKRLEELK